MTLKRLFKDEDAVSPVIGVILMVAITVILAAVIGTFVLGLGDQVQQTSPTASVTFSQSNDGAGNVESVTIAHDSGKSLNPDNIKVLHNGEKIDVGDSNDDVAVQWAGGEDEMITAGETVEVGTGGDGDGDQPNIQADDTIKVVWTSDDGSQSDTLQEYTVS